MHLNRIFSALGRAASRLGKLDMDTAMTTATAFGKKISNAWTLAQYYKGGFEPKMTNREAAKILGISPSSNRAKIERSYRRIMVVNHPDKGGSPYLATKINQARECLTEKMR